MILLMPISASFSSLAPWNSAGYSIAPTPTIVPWPTVRRGTEWLVPIVPGLVSEIVTPEKSSAVSLFVRALRTMSSYDAQNCEKLMFSQPLRARTTSVRDPSLPFMSMARPRLTCPGSTTAGLPFSSSPKCRFMFGKSARALTIA
jgi:hypothetical protein